MCESYIKTCFQVAAKALEMAVYGAYYNVTINLQDITDDDFKAAVSALRCSLFGKSLLKMHHPIKFIFLFH